MHCLSLSWPAYAASSLLGPTKASLGMHTVHQLASTPNVLVFMGSRKIAAAEEALAKFASDVHPSSTVVPIQVDITDDASIKSAHASISKHLQGKNLPGLDVLVNNAAVVGSSFEATYAVNVFGTVAITDAIRPLLNNGGAILNISSNLGSLHGYTQRPPPPVYLSYSSSKSALNSLTLQWAIQEEQKGSNIRVVSINPGYNATNLNNYRGTMDPQSDGCKVIVKAALEKEGKERVG
ncbi:Short-chain dehydrogenase/reductase family protein [Mycena venus]|uniref:Short-chain dehydrogenase/reductase family protein n=1 Tax=Mycena venus TaxID=2733690 RepID=A0A8H6XC56_9AGAR|nr:Short-chain dehydrogenase/reductase family protein [Mycena venus]